MFVIEEPTYNKKEIWLYELFGDFECNNELNFSWWQFGRFNWHFEEKTIKTSIDIIELHPLLWRKTYNHEYGHYKTTKLIVGNYRGDSEDELNKLITKANNDYDIWNWHGCLFWRYI